MTVPATFRTPLCDLLAFDVPIMLAGMGGVSCAEVCAAVSDAGAYGTLGMANEGPDGIREILSCAEIFDRTMSEAGQVPGRLAGVVGC